MFEPAVQGFGGAIRGAGPVEVGQHVGGPLLQRAAERGDLGQRGGDAAAEGGDDGLHAWPALRGLGFAVGGDHPLVDRPGGFDFDVLIAGEQGFQPGLLPGGEQIQAGVQGATGPVERIISAAAVAVQVSVGPGAGTRRGHRRPT